MRRLRYHLLDVFTDRLFGGNQLAVFTNGRGVSTELMQSIAKELKLSETVFVLPPEDDSHDFRLRIFTPAVELPMAGHPTIGTAFVLAQEQMIAPGSGETVVRFKEGVGVINVNMRFERGEPTLIQMNQPLPAFGPCFDDLRAIAEMLALPPQTIDTATPLEVISCGLPFLFVPVRDLRSVQSIQFRLDVWERLLQDFAGPHVYVFSREVETEGSTVHSRMFAPAMGIIEDPATGSASGPLGCYLVRHGLVPRSPSVEITSEQGFELGRPSFIKIVIEQENGEITGVRVGGQCRSIGEGFLEVG